VRDVLPHVILSTPLGVSKNPFLFLGGVGDADPSTALRLLRMTIRSAGRTSACHSEHPVRGVEESVPFLGGVGDADPSAKIIVCLPPAGIGLEDSLRSATRSG